MRRVLIMAGGTGGHVYPGLVIAKKLQSFGAEVYWLGTRRGLEAEVVQQAGLPIYYISAVGIRGKGIINLFLSPLRISIACIQAFIIFLKVKPDCVLGMGGFVSGPGGLLAWLLQKPLIIHEQNAIMGTTNRLLAKFARKVFLGNSKLRLNVPSPKIEIVGNPVREEILAIKEPRQRFAECCGRLRLLVLGGSLGALALNQLLVEALAGLSKEDCPDIWHQTGKLHYDATVQAYRDNTISGQIMPFADSGTPLYPHPRNKCWAGSSRALCAPKMVVLPFIADMAAAYAWADLVLCRAGAMTISELMAAGVASILVPFPYAIDDHQTHNSEQLVQAGAAICVQQRDLSPALLTQWLTEFSHDRARLLKMAEAGRALNKTIGNAAEKIASACLEV